MARGHKKHHVRSAAAAVAGKDGALKSLAAKNAAAKAEKAKQKMEAARAKEEKAASGPSEAENALQVYLQARQKLGAPKADIKLNSIDLRSLDGSELLLGTDLTLNQGRRYGLIGRNGAGKSTLLREIAYYRFDKFPKNLKVLMVEQEVVGDERKPVEWVLHSDVERRLLLQEQKALQDKDAKDALESERLKQIADRLQEIGADDAEPRAAKILRGLYMAFHGEQMSSLIHEQPPAARTAIHRGVAGYSNVITVWWMADACFTGIGAICAA